MKRRLLAVLGILAMLLSLLFNPGAGHAQTGAYGTVVAWGDNSRGQTDVPAGLSDVTAISAGAWHNLVLKNDGTVVAWGCGGGFDFGQCNVPADLTGVTAISAGYYHNLVLKADDTVVAWGYNSDGETTIPAGLGSITAIDGGSHYSLALKSDGTVVAWGSNSQGQASVPAGLSGVTAIAAGCAHSLALKSDGTVVAWGWNGLGQTAVPAGLSGVTAIAAGCDYSLALKSDGTVVGWGSNYDGQITIPAGLSGVTAIATGRTHSLALKSDGTVVGWGSNYDGQITIPAGLSGVTAIAGGEMHSLALVQANAAPAAQDQSVSTNEDTPLAITLIATQTETAALTYSIVSNPAHGVLSGTAPNVTYTPDANWNGTDHFTFKANDGLRESNIATVTITVNPVNDAPLAVDQSVATPRNTPLAITLTATDVENSAMTYTIVTGPDHGTLSGAAPNLTYTPNDAYAGDDFIYFRANDGELDSNVVMINISVFIVFHHPVALADSYSTNVNTALTVAAPGVLSNDTDEDGDPLYAHHVSGPAHGTLTLNVDGSFDYEPETNYAGQDSFIYRALDGELASNDSTVSITVNQNNNAPVAIDDSYSVIANTTLTVSAPGVLGNDTDADGGTLTAALVRSPAHGTLTLNAGGSFVYIPATNYAGPDSFTYKANDGQTGSNIATVNIAIRYSFAGFFEPVDNPGAGPTFVFNNAKAGSAVPVKFSLGGDQGLDIFAVGFPTSQPVSCTILKSSSATVRTVIAGSSSLTYDPATGLYNYIWKTDKKWGGKCRVLIVQLDDGTQHLAYFQFK